MIKATIILALLLALFAGFISCQQFYYGPYGNQGQDYVSDSYYSQNSAGFSEQQASAYPGLGGYGEYVDVDVGSYYSNKK